MRVSGTKAALLNNVYPTLGNGSPLKDKFNRPVLLAYNRNNLSRFEGTKGTIVDKYRIN